MPSLLNDVWGSTLNDFTHKGPNQGGNKSLLSYNSSTGIPGCTTFIPAHSAVVLPIKCFQHTGRPVDAKTREDQLLATSKKAAASEYRTAYHKKPGDTQPNDHTGGGYWIRSMAPIPPASFTAASTYKAEMQQAASTAEAQLTRSLGLRCTLAPYEAARMTAPRAQTADSLRSPRGLASATRTLATQRPATAVTSTGKVVGYQSTNADMLVANPLTGGPAAPGAVRPPAAPRQEEPRYTTMPHAMPPGMYGAASSYVREHGADTSDPMERSAPAERFQTRCTTGRDLAAGTTRATNNPPGYTGHIAASRYNTLGQAHSAAADERLDLKADMLLYQLDQFSRARLPHYTGVKPQAARNITLQQPSQGPPKNTTMGAACLQATKYGVPQHDTTHHNNSREGILTFFTSMGETVSDNGLANAQAYYSLTKEMGSKFKHTHLDHITHYGKPFNPRNSLV